MAQSIAYLAGSSNGPVGLSAIDADTGATIDGFVPMLRLDADGTAHAGYTPPQALPVYLLAELAAPDPEPEPECCPLSNSRLFKGIASRYRASQHQPVRARRSQKRCLQVDFNGALDAGETVTRVMWECTSPWITFMESACIGNGGRYVCTDVTFNYPGIGNIKATIDTSTGRRENYEFEITVTDAPMYPSAQYIPSNGPYQLVAEA